MSLPAETPFLFEFPCDEDPYLDDSVSIPAETPFIIEYPCDEDEDPYLDDSDMSDSIQPGYEPEPEPRYEIARNWTQLPFDFKLLERVCFTVYICAYRDASNAHTSNEAYYAFLFQYKVEACIRVEMTLGNGNIPITGKLEFEKIKPYDCWEPHIVKSYVTRNFPTLQEFIDVLVSRGRQRYSFNSQGEGSRHWILTVMKDFVDAGLLGAGAAEDLAGSLHLDWKWPTAFGEKYITCGFFI